MVHRKKTFSARRRRERVCCCYCYCCDCDCDCDCSCDCDCIGMIKWRRSWVSHSTSQFFFQFGHCWVLALSSNRELLLPASLPLFVLLFAISCLQSSVFSLQSSSFSFSASLFLFRRPFLIPHSSFLFSLFSLELICPFFIKRAPSTFFCLFYILLFSCSSFWYWNSLVGDSHWFQSPFSPRDESFFVRDATGLAADGDAVERPV